MLSNHAESGSVFILFDFPNTLSPYFSWSHFAKFFLAWKCSSQVFCLLTNGEDIHFSPNLHAGFYIYYSVANKECSLWKITKSSDYWKAFLRKTKRFSLNNVKSVTSFTKYKYRWSLAYPSGFAPPCKMAEKTWLHLLFWAEWVGNRIGLRNGNNNK